MYKRYLAEPLKSALSDTPVIMLNGARQAGKSTFCRQLIVDGVFGGQLLTLDDLTTLQAARHDPPAFLDALGKSLIIDEVQRVPELLLSIKKLTDEDRKGRRYILTGSADVMTFPQVADSLTGRMEIMNLWPLSQNEIKGTPAAFLDRLLAPGPGFDVAQASSWDDLIASIIAGGYPEPLQRGSEARRARWFESYITSILQKDIRDLANIEGLDRIPAILQHLAVRIGSTINFSDISRLSGVKNTSLQRYTALLEHIFLIVKIPAWAPNAEGAFVKSPKIYLNDTGLLCHLRGDTIRSLAAARGTVGALLENFVVLDILKQLSWSKHLLRPYHFSIHKGHEVDLVLVDRKSQLYGIEIKAATALHASDFNGLRKLASLSGGKFQKGIVLYSGDRVVPFGDNLFAVPIAAVWG